MERSAMQSFSSFIWVPGTKLWSSGLEAGAFNCRTSSLAWEGFIWKQWFSFLNHQSLVLPSYIQRMIKIYIKFDFSLWMEDWHSEMWAFADLSVHWNILSGALWSEWYTRISAKSVNVFLSREKWWSSAEPMLNAQHHPWFPLFTTNA